MKSSSIVKEVEGNTANVISSEDDLANPAESKPVDIDEGGSLHVSNLTR
jgi:hypothetical protein